MGMGIHIDLRRRWYRIRNVTTIRRMTLSGEREPEAIARRRVLSLLGLFGVMGLVAPSMSPTVSAAEASAIPRAYDQVDKPLPGEGGAPRTSPQLDKPIPADRSEEYTSELQSHSFISYAVFCLK